MSYQSINQNPKIYWSGSPETIYKIIQLGGQIEQLTNLYGYCVGIGYGKTGFNWVIGNLFNNQLEIYWCKLDFNSPENIEIIAKILQKRSARNTEKITKLAFIAVSKMAKDVMLIHQIDTMPKDKPVSVLALSEDDLTHNSKGLVFGTKERTIAANYMISAIDYHLKDNPPDSIEVLSRVSRVFTHFFIKGEKSVV